MPTSWGSGAALGLGLGMGIAAGALSGALRAPDAAEPPHEDHLEDVILVEASAEIGAQGQRRGPVRLQAAAAPRPPVARGGCEADGPLRGGPVAADLRVELLGEVALGWSGARGQHRALVDDPGVVWADLSWREAAVAAAGWRRGGALRTADQPAVGVAEAGAAELDALRLILPGPTGPRRCPLSPESLAVAARGGASLERWVERELTLPDGRQLRTRSRLRAPWAGEPLARPLASERGGGPARAPRRDLRVIRRLPA